MTAGAVEGTSNGGPLGELSRLLQVLHSETRRDSVRLRRNERNRLNLLVVHALAAQVIALLFILSRNVFTGPSWDLLRHLPLFPYSMAVALGLGGMILLPATIARNRRWEMVGLFVLYLWYAALSFGFAVPSFRWGYAAVVATAAGDPVPAQQPGLYAWVVYCHLAVIMRVHIWTLSRMNKEHDPNLAGAIR